MKESIKNRLVKSFMLIIIITVLILEFSLINGIKSYYYNTIEEVLTNQLRSSISYIDRYLAYNSLEHIVMDDIDIYWTNTAGQIQIYDSKENLLLDSLGLYTSKDETPADVKKAYEGERGYFLGINEYFEEETMSISMPIEEKNEVVGVLRFTTSMHETNEVIKYLSFLLLVMGLIVILISGLVSYFMANSIVKPLQDVTETAEKMADGQLDVRSYVEFDDEIGKLSDTLNYMAEEILKKEEVKNEFISSISHELKTPLTSIKGWAITLQYENIEENENLYEGLKIIEEESDRLSEMLEELLDFSRFVSNEITLKKTEINLNDLLSQIYKQLNPRAELNKLNLVINLDSDVGNIMGDRDRLKQVLINILDNAFKFSEEGSSIIMNSFRDNKYIIVEIIDEGIGISKTELPYVKERFFKGKSAKSHSGIGLSISEEIVSLHGGKLDIESELGKGTTVRILLPLEEVEI